MRLPLLIAASARMSNGSRNVRLHSGVWKIVLDGVNSSGLSIKNGVQTSECINGMLINGPAEVSIGFTSRGSEDAVSVYAELQ